MLGAAARSLATASTGGMRSGGKVADGMDGMAPRTCMASDGGGTSDDEISEAVILDGQAMVSAAKVRKAGVTLPEMGRLLDGLGLPHVIQHARGTPGTRGPATRAEAESALMLEATRALRKALHAAPMSATLVNYHMGVAGHRPFGGHFSPLAAYHAPSDRFLVLDCWPRTEPCWHRADCLWAALTGTDTESGLSRGWVVVGDSCGAELGS